MKDTEKEDCLLESYTFSFLNQVRSGCRAWAHPRDTADLARFLANHAATAHPPKPPCRFICWHPLMTQMAQILLYLLGPCSNVKVVSQENLDSWAEVRYTCLAPQHGEEGLVGYPDTLLEWTSSSYSPPAPLFPSPIPPAPASHRKEY